MKHANMKRFTDSVVMITGSATGIGEAAAYRFAKEGAHIICVDHNAEENEKTARQCRDAYGVETCVINQPVETEGLAKKAVEKAMSVFDRIDVLVCSAGIYTGADLDKVPFTQWQKLIDINLTGTFLYNQAVAPIMKQQRSGSIINVSSMAGNTSWPGTAEYSASKSGVIGLTRSVAMELGEYGVTANSLCPGNTLTKMVLQVADTVGQKYCDMSGEEWLDMRAQDTALKRNAEPWEQAGVIAFLASDDSRFLTGQSIEVDGGIILK